MPWLTLNYLTLNKRYLSLIVVGTYKHFASRFLANLMQDGGIYLSGMMKSVQSFALFLYCYAVCTVQVSMVGSYFQVRGTKNLSRQ